MDFSLLIITKNRPFLLTRALEYYTTWNCKIIICDGSIEKYENRILENKLIRYLQTPNLSVQEKILNGISEINTTYMCIASDDDYLLLSGIKEGLVFLQNNSDYVGVQGQFANFKNFDSRILFKNTYPENFNRIISSDIPSERIIFSFNNLMHHVYSLQRVEQIKIAIELTTHLKSMVHIEHNLILIPLIFGKFMSMNHLWMIRDSAIYYNYYDDSKLDEYLYLNFSDYIRSCEYKIYRNKFNEIYTNETGSNDGIELFDHIYKIYLQKEKPSLGLIIKRFLLRNVIIKKVHYLFKSNKNENYISLEKLYNKDSNWTKNKREIDMIYKSIESNLYLEYMSN